MRRSIVVAALGTSQTLAWASTYYVPAILAEPIARDIGITQAVFFGVFSASLLLSAALGPMVGRRIDLVGGRGMLAWSNLVIALGLALLGMTQNLATLMLAWGVLGIGMAMGLYDPAFAALARLYGSDARGAITGVTLFAGFASTIGWPVSAYLAGTIGWQDTCFVWAALHIVLGLPLNRLVLPTPPQHATEVAPIAAAIGRPAASESKAGEAGEGAAAPAPPYAMAVLAFVFAATWFVTAALAAHLPTLFRLCGATQEAAIAAAALVGPAQVAARLVEFSLLRRVHPLVSARLAAVLHPIGAALLAALGAPAASLFAMLHGAGNGMLTIAKGTLPLALFGPAGYGHRSGLLSVPARGTQAAAPFLFGLVLEVWGPLPGLALTTGLTLSALLALFALRARR